MKTVILFGLLWIAEAIGAGTGWSLSDIDKVWFCVLILMALASDFVDFFHKMYGK